MKDVTNYGFPLFSILIRMTLLQFFILILISFLFIPFYIGALIVSFLIFFFVLFIVISFKKKFIKYRNMILEKMINHAKLKGDEVILDLGTGSGFIAIGFAKKLSTGKVFGIDKYSIRNGSITQQIKNMIKINFFGNTHKNAERNAIIEKVEKKSKFFSADLTKSFNFPDQYFNIVLSSQFLYCLPYDKQESTLKEINRILKKGGKIIFFESESFLNWDIKKVGNFFKKMNFDVQIIHEDILKSGCILVGKKL